MNAFVTAQLTQKGIEELSRHLKLTFGGWGYEGTKLKPHQLVDRARGCEILIIGYEDIDEHVFKHMPNLKYIACTRGGIENIDVNLVKNYGVTLSNTPGRNASAVADLTLGLIIAVSRNIPQTYRLIMEKRWEEVPWDIAGNTPYKRFEGVELEGKTLGLIGFGAIGRKVAKRALGFDMNIIVYDPFIQPDENITVSSDLQEVLSSSDFVSLHCKLTEETRGIINQRTISKMKRSAYLINTARGGLIHESELYAALQEKRIAGAALDVLIQEPMNPGHNFLELDNVVVTPHIGGASKDIILHQTEMIVNDVIRYIHGKRPVYAIE